MKNFISFLLLLVLGGTSGFTQGTPSLFSDIKAHEVGDIISVILAENAYAVQEHNSNNSSNSSNKIDAAASGNIVDFLPVFGGSSNMGSDYKGTNASQQKDRLSGRLTVRIIEKTESGMFKIKGEREVGVNGEDNIMKLEGYVRPKDISTDNIIYSYQIANAKIDYRQGGLTDSFIKPGTFPKLFTFLAGGLMVAAGAGFFVFSK